MNHNNYLLLLITIITCIITPSSQSQTPNTIYTLLTNNALPTGLFPTGITNFTTTHDQPNQTHFTAYLNSSCSTKFETSVKFSLEISGVVRYGEIVNLTGVVTQDLFLWFPVKGIHVDVPSSGVIYFDVGVVWKRFAVSLFEYPREFIFVIISTNVDNWQCWPTRSIPEGNMLKVSSYTGKCDYYTSRTSFVLTQLLVHGMTHSCNHACHGLGSLRENPKPPQLGYPLIVFVSLED
ncbi:hypothetical protein CTI12_AA255400 [Artemisia annua]|uniref:Uncharacterized protein n=1 Tax=Artemisia annua TaxID=35608 RepID=A0A2U1NKW8_ARTAN|nr:hypothetical protein CTI12_AA255400 [Artemisia annua]